MYTDTSQRTEVLVGPDVTLDSGLECVQTPIYLVVETSGSNTEHDYAKLEVFLEEAYNDELVVNGIIAQDSAQQAAVWNLRESISEGLRHAGFPLFIYARTQV